MEALRRVGFIATVAALAAALPAQLAAQQGSVEVDAHGGLAVAGGELQDVVDFGPSAGLDVRYWLTDRVGIMVGGGVDLLSGKDADELTPPSPSPGGDPLFLPAVEGPDTDMFHFGGGFSFLLTPPTGSPWSLTVDAAIGGTHVDPDISRDELPVTLPVDIDGDGAPDDPNIGSFTIVSIQPGLTVGYQVNDRIGVFARGTGRFSADADAQDTQQFAIFDAGIDGRGFENVWTVPITGGVRISF